MLRAEYGRRSRRSVIKRQHMAVCVKRMRKHQAGWHRRIFVLSQQLLQGRDFFVFGSRSLQPSFPNKPQAYYGVRPSGLQDFRSGEYEKIY